MTEEQKEIILRLTRYLESQDLESPLRFTQALHNIGISECKSLRYDEKGKRLTYDHRDNYNDTDRDVLSRMRY